MMNRRNSFVSLGLMACAAFFLTLSGCASPAKDTAKQNQVETDVDVALAEFRREAPSAWPVVENAKGVLVCPKIAKAGFIVGVEGGTCAMRIDGMTSEYYRTSSLKAGLLAGVQSQSLLLTFKVHPTKAYFVS